MKLKKIVSLALAGVMAVSMLAGCSNGNTTDNGTTDPTVPATGISAKVDAMLADKDKIELTDNATYNTYLSAAIEDADLKASELTGVTTANWSDSGNVYTALSESFTHNVVGYKNTLKVSSYAKVTDASENVSMSLFTAPGTQSEDVVLNALVNVMDTALKDKLPSTVTVGSDVYSEKYTGSVSMQKVTDGSASAWYILVVVANDATKL